MPQGTVPVLEMNGKIKISQSTAIARHLAREFKFYGKNNAERTQIDQIFDTLIGMYDGMDGAVRSSSKPMTAAMADYSKEKVPAILDILEKLVDQLGKGGFAVGSSLTMADLALHVYIEGVLAKDKLEKYPQLQGNRMKVETVPRIAKYLETRPKTDL